MEKGWEVTGSHRLWAETLGHSSYGDWPEPVCPSPWPFPDIRNGRVERSTDLPFKAVRDGEYEMRTGMKTRREATGSRSLVVGVICLLPIRYSLRGSLL
jgi:hypothetical protein